MLPVPNTSLTCWASNELPWWTTFHTCCHNSARRIKHVLCDFTRGEDFWKLAAGFLWTVPRAPFPFLPLYIFTVLNHSKSLTICRVLSALLVTCWSWTWKSLDTQSSHLRTLERFHHFLASKLVGEKLDASLDVILIFSAQAQWLSHGRNSNTCPKMVEKGIL